MNIVLSAKRLSSHKAKMYNSDQVSRWLVLEKISDIALTEDVTNETPQPSEDANTIDTSSCKIAILPSLATSTRIANLF